MTTAERAPITIVLLLGLALVASGCRPAAAPAHAWHLAAADVVHARGHTLDVYTPVSPPAGPAPVVVLLHGCCGDRSDVVKLAEAVASRGIVTFNADWPGVGANGRFPWSFDVAACAVRYARAHAERHGGDPARIAVVGWSDGAMAAALITLAPHRWSTTDCAANADVGTPHLIGVDGFYGWRQPVGADYVTARSRRFLGGSPRSADAAWREATPYHWVGRMTPIAATLIVGASTPVRPDAVRFGNALRRAGHQARVDVLAGGRGASTLSSRTELGRRTAAAVAMAVHDMR